MFALPVKLGGLAISIPSEICKIQYTNPVAGTKSLVDHVINQKVILELDENSIKEVKN